MIVQAQVARQRQDCAQDGDITRVFTDVAGEGAVDFQRVEGQALEIAE